MKFSQLNPGLIPVLLGLCILMLFIATGHVITRYRTRKKKEKFVFSGNIGEHLMLQLECLDIEIPLQFSRMLLIPLLTGGVVLYSFYFVNRDWRTIENITFIITATVLALYFFLKASHKLFLKRRMRRAYDGDILTGRELQKFENAGYHVFHHFHLGKHIIDHIAISSKGVFTIKTNAASQCPSGSSADDCPVVYNGHALHFPNKTDVKTVAKAREQAEWLSGWLSESLGKPLAARAIVSIPGWLIKRTTREGIPVVNPSQFDSLFEHIKPRPLEQDEIGVMVKKIEQIYGH